MTSKTKAPPALTHVVVLAVETEDSSWVKVFQGYTSAQRWLADWCRENWEPDELGVKPDKDADPHEVCETYFDRDDGSGLCDFSETADLTIHDLSTMKEIPFKKIPKAVMSA